MLLHHQSHASFVCEHSVYKQSVGPARSKQINGPNFVWMWRFLFNTGIATLAGVPAFWVLKLSWTRQISADLLCAVRTYIQSVGSSSLVHFKMVCCLFSCRRIDFRRRLFWHKNGSKHAYRWLVWPFHGWNLILVSCPTNWNRSQNAVAPVK